MDNKRPFEGPSSCEPMMFPTTSRKRWDMESRETTPNPDNRGEIRNLGQIIATTWWWYSKGNPRTLQKHPGW